jgi:hypothetical protein
MTTQTMVRSGRLRETTQALSLVVGLAAVFFSALYFVSDLMEFAQGGFSTVQLTLTLAAEAAIPFFVVGLYVLHRPRIGRLGLAGTAVYGYTFVFFTGTVSFALVDGTKDWDALVDRLVPWMTIHGVLMVVAGLAFGLAIVRERVLPRWTGVTLMAGMVFMAASSGLPPLAQTASAGIRDLAFAGMGASVLVSRRRRRDVAPPIPVLEVSDVGGRRWAS